MHFILHFTRIVRQKLAYAGHVFRESIGLNALLHKGNLKQGSKRKAQKDMDWWPAAKDKEKQVSWS